MTCVSQAVNNIFSPHPPHSSVPPPPSPSLFLGSSTPQEESVPELNRLRLSEGGSVPDMKQVGSGVRGSEVNQPQLASSSQESDPTPPTPSAGGAKRDHTSSRHPLGKRMLQCLGTIWCGKVVFLPHVCVWSSFRCQANHQTALNTGDQVRREHRHRGCSGCTLEANWVLF